MTEVVQVVPMETMHMKLTNPRNAPKPPPGPKPPNGSKSKHLRLDPLRALEPARKKLSTLEAQRIMAVLVDTIRKSEIVTCLPYIIQNLEGLKISLGTELVTLLENHEVIIESFEDLKKEAANYLEEQEDLEAQNRKIAEDVVDEFGEPLRPISMTNIRNKVDAALRNLQHVAKQMQNNCKDILRAFSINPTAMQAVLKDKQERSPCSRQLLVELGELKDIIMGMLLTTPVEELERNQYLQEVSERERKNAEIIKKLDSELKLAQADKDAEVREEVLNYNRTLIRKYNHGMQIHLSNYLFFRSKRKMISSDNFKLIFTKLKSFLKNTFVEQRMNLTNKRLQI